MKQWALWVLIFLLAGSFAEGQNRSARAIRDNLEAARKRVYPALVNITCVTRYFVGGRAQRSPSGGSGVIVTPQGHVLTNYHVAGRATLITCTLPGGETLEADVVAHDPLTDLSVLKLRTNKRTRPRVLFPYAKLGNSDALRVGDTVIALGNPLMLSSSMTLGIVSNTQRVFTDFTGTELEEQELDRGEKTGMFTRWIQHDALILPGNSGGPLVNTRGEVVGINELGGSGVGFAIPSNIAAMVLKEVLAYGRVRRGWLGISILPVEKLGRKTGALVASVSPGSPAEKAGLLPGDILLSLNGKPIHARFFEQVPLVYQCIAAMRPGTKVQIRCLRGGKPRALVATVALMERFVGDEEEIRNMGVTIQELTTAMAQARRLPGMVGVLITGLRPGYPFEGAQPRLAPGDVVLSVGGQPTPNIAAFRRALAATKKREIPIAFRRRDEQLVAVVKMPEESSSDASRELPKAWIGIKTQVVTPEIAAALGIPDARGFRVTEVYPGTQASRAGLQVGDVITALNGEALMASRAQDAQDLRRAVEDMSVGEEAELRVLRLIGAERKVLPIKLALEAAPRSDAEAKKLSQKEFEFIAREITPLDRMENRWVKDAEGLIVADVTMGGWAQMAGLRVDDVILSVNGIPTPNVEALEKAFEIARKSRRSVITIFVRRGYRTHFVFIEPDWSKLLNH